MRPRLGIVCRSDMGGLAAQSIDMAKHLQPDATLIVDLGDKGRGKFVERDWPNPIHTKLHNGPRSWLTETDKLVEFCKQVDVILSIETFYGEKLQEIARSLRVKTVRYINPELYRHEPCDQEVLSSEWEADRFPNTPIIPQGIEAPEDKRGLRTELKRVFHQATPAMLDRNGTNVVLQALRHTKYKYEMVIHGFHPSAVNQLALDHRHTYAFNYDFADRWEMYDEGLDLLLYPRRYGGNSLTMVEAAACGIPILATDCPPQNGWLTRDAMIPVESIQTQAFIGGKFKVYNADPRRLAALIDRLHDDPIQLQKLSHSSLQFAGSRSWDVIRPQWDQLFSQVVGQTP